ncbi:hypothetical protein [Treponema phagedenis]|uniref:hypothetical protein n=1 Tax=Treponema phagedenis TaxID=162 RepID=UPI0015A6BCCA|nr:hypothetical protein [Treponema phagedenis]NVP24403.1 hypothetical protein [Treponema phagedenis]
MQVRTVLPASRESSVSFTIKKSISGSSSGLIACAGARLRNTGMFFFCASITAASTVGIGVSSCSTSASYLRELRAAFASSAVTFSFAPAITIMRLSPHEFPAE